MFITKTNGVVANGVVAIKVMAPSTTEMGVIDGAITLIMPTNKYEINANTYGIIQNLSSPLQGGLPPLNEACPILQICVHICVFHAIFDFRFYS